MKSQGCISAIQLAHAGRKASTAAPWLGGLAVNEEGHGWPEDVVGPSPSRYDGTYAPVKELSVSRIHEIARKFGESATRAIKAGIKVCLTFITFIDISAYSRTGNRSSRSPRLFASRVCVTFVES